MTTENTRGNMSITECEVVRTKPNLVVIVGSEVDTLASVLHVSDIHNLGGGRDNYRPLLSDHIEEHERVSLLNE
jgi:hypothetical protein